MNVFLVISLSLMTALIALPIAMFVVEVALAVLFGAKKIAVSEEGPLPTGAILMPAHNEETVIADTLSRLMPSLPASTRVVVIADNCSDNTAEIARSFGVDVIERSHAIDRGKGFALDAGMRYIADAPPEVVMIVDADCQVAPDSIRQLLQAVKATGRSVQGAVTMSAPPGAGPLQHVSALAFQFKNTVRGIGLYRMIRACHLFGTGMAFPWEVLKKAKLASGNVVEDMQLGVDLVIAGSAPQLLSIAHHTSPLPSQKKAIISQRTRWEHGHLQTILSEVPKLLVAAITRCRLDIALFALDLAIPPLSLLVLGWSVAFALSIAAIFLGQSAAFASILATSGLLLAISILAGWYRFCRDEVSLGTLFLAPFYALSKLPIYMGFLTKRQKSWVRTDRDTPKPPLPIHGTPI